MGNKLDKDLIPHLEVDIYPVEPEIQIRCKTQVKNESCDKGFALPPRGKGLVALELDVRIGNPKLNEYKLCLKTIDGRINRNHLQACKELQLIKNNR